MISYIFFFNDTATTEIYTLSLHDALPISQEHLRPQVHHAVEGFHILPARHAELDEGVGDEAQADRLAVHQRHHGRSEEHTSELQSRQYLVCRLLLEKKKKHTILHI